MTALHPPEQSPPAAPDAAGPDAAGSDAAGPDGIDTDGIGDTGGPGRRRPPAASPWRRYRPLLLVALALAALVAVGPRLVARFQPHLYAGTVLQDDRPAPSLEGLRYTSGQPVTMAGLDGKVTLVLFGYTNCPDECPTAMASLARTMAELSPSDRNRVRVLMVTVDNTRDDAATLERYVTSFDPSFQGVLGPDEVTAEVASLYGVFYAPDEEGGSTIDHSISLIGIGSDGALRVVWPPNVGERALASDVRALLG